MQDIKLTLVVSSYIAIDPPFDKELVFVNLHSKNLIFIFRELKYIVPPYYYSHLMLVNVFVIKLIFVL